jgi:hypothetical protein
VDRNDELPVVTFTKGKNIQDAVASLKLSEGESVEVYRVAAPARKVTVKTETTRKVVIE